MTRPSEKDVVAAWQRRMRSGTALTTEQGEPVEIIYPGRRNDGQGADYQDAVIISGGRLVKGDIEVHVRSSDWISHRHHLDPTYDRVVLHVVWWHDKGVPTSLCSGGMVPVFALSTSRGEAVIERGSAASHSLAAMPTPCTAGVSDIPIEMLTRFLDQAGDDRFLARAAEFQKDMAETGTGQVLYRGIMGALGYSRNKAACLELADRLPLAELESISSGIPSYGGCVTQLQALLIGTAGLLPSQRGSKFQDRPAHRYISRLERLWSSYFSGREMSLDMWHLSCTRPYNSPLRRLVAMSYLIGRYREEGLMSGLWGRYVSGVPSCQDWRQMEEDLLVNASGYWGHHFDFSLTNRGASPTVLGAGRASDIMVNVLLPFTYVWARCNGRPELETAALDAYRSYPRLADNALLRHMKSQLQIGHRTVNSARRQQGLLHVYRTLCTQGLCQCCPLSFPCEERV